jgi:hypothetical protein
MIAERLGSLRVDSNGGVRWFAGKRGEDWEWREGRGSPDGGGIERKRPQVSGSSARNLGSLAASLVKLGEGKGRGVAGYL